jgi:hypothetical protein
LFTFSETYMLPSEGNSLVSAIILINMDIDA